jgi:hypothetical protein
VLDDVQRRRVILHYHLMKNAGTTITAVLEREFGEGYRDVHRATEGAIFAPEVRAVVDSVPGLRALSSHHFRFPGPRDDSQVMFFDCCPLRHPIDRLVSLYTFFRHSPSESSPGNLAGSSDVRTFLEMLMERFPNYAYNVQTGFLVNGGRFRGLSAIDLDDAVAVVRRSTLPIVVHRLDESLTLAEYFLGPALPGLQLHFTPQNVARPLHGDLASREAALRAELGPSYERLALFNAYDLQLVAAADDEIDQRIAVVPDFARRLADFRARCRAVAAPSA